MYKEVTSSHNTFWKDGSNSSGKKTKKVQRAVFMRNVNSMERDKNHLQSLQPLKAEW